METRVRGSRFLVLAAPVDSESAARRLLDERARILFDATHHCAAWRLRSGAWRALDAGEPPGSAGAPILAAIDAEELQDVVVIVTRYFGGTKLGVGGLGRAYREAAHAALESAGFRRGQAGERVRVRYAFEHTASVMKALQRCEAHDLEHAYAGGSGRPEISCTIPLRRVAELGASLKDRTSGGVTLELLGKSVIYAPERRR